VQVTGTPNKSVNWTLSNITNPGNPAPGSLSSGGLYTAPASIASPVNLTVTATSAADNVTLATAALSLSATAASTGATASFIAADTTTQGNWIGTYGGDGYSMPNGTPNAPSYAALTASGQSSYTWAASTADVRAPQNPGGSGRMASVWYSGSSFTLDVNLKDGNTHQVALYALDWDNYQGGRAEQIQVLDASSNAVLDTRNATGFQNGQYFVWNINGHVKFLISTTNPNSNAAISGIFFQTGSTTSTAATATFSAMDATHQGNWIGTYGANGYSIPNGSQSLPAYASLAVSGQSSYTWAATTSDIRAPQNPGGSGRTASVWYSAPSFTLDVNMKDGNTHTVALYALDWDNYQGGRAEQIQVLDAGTNAVLDTRNISAFQNGVYLTWTISGHVRIVLTTTNPNSNAVISGIFF